MNYSYIKMIRHSRCLITRKNILLFTQRIALPQKHCSTEFCTAADPQKDLKNGDSTKGTFADPQKDFKNGDSTKGTFATDNHKKGIENSKMFKNIFKGYLKSKVITPSDSEAQVQVFLQNIGDYSTQDIVQVIQIFAEGSNRAVLILKPLCDAVVMKAENLSEELCSDFLYCLSKLSYKHEPSIKFVVEQLKKKKRYNSPFVLQSVLRSLAELKYRDTDLLESIAYFILQNSCHVKVLVGALMSFSCLNFAPPYIDYIIKNLTRLDSTEFIQTKDYVNYIWASVILNKISILSENQLLHVLSESFHEQLNRGMRGLTPGFKLKLLNINAAASQLPSYKGPLLNDLSEYKIMQPLLSSKTSPFLESVKDSLSYIVPKGCTMEFSVETGSGFYIDIQFPIKSKEKSKKSKKENKLGIVLLNYNDVCSDKTLTGMAAFKLNILKNLGHTILPLPFFEYPLNAKLSEKIFYLRHKIKDLGIECDKASDKDAK